MLGQVIWPLFLIGGLGLALLLAWVWLRRGHARPGRWTQLGFWSCEAALGGLSLWFSWHLGSPIYFLIFAAMIFPLLRLWQEMAAQTTPATARTGRVSVWQSPWLVLRIDHDNGTYTGQMLRGAMQDWQLHEMDGHDLQKTRAEILAADPCGGAMFDLWLDRHGPLHWRKDFGTDTTAKPLIPDLPHPTRGEAAAMLGLAPDASPQDIEAVTVRLQEILGKNAHHNDFAAWIAAARTALAG